MNRLETKFLEINFMTWTIYKTYNMSNFETKCFNIKCLESKFQNIFRNFKRYKMKNYVCIDEVL